MPVEPPAAPHPNLEKQTASDTAHTTETDVLRNVRVLEERFMNLRRKAQLIDDKLLHTEDHVRDEIKAVTSDIAAIRRQFADMQETVVLMQGELSHAANRYELKALEKYVGYWAPMSFVTKEELMRNGNLLKEPSRKEQHAPGHAR